MGKIYIDVFGNTLELGDTVAFYAPSYRVMVTGEVISFTPKQVRVKYFNTWNYSGSGYEETYLNYSRNFAKKVTHG
jgi:hypothetical protein